MIPTGFLGSTGVRPCKPSSMIPPPLIASAINRLHSLQEKLPIHIAPTTPREVTSITVGNAWRRAGGSLPGLRGRPGREQRAERRHERQRLVDHHVMLGLGDLDIRGAGRNEAS